ncbi:MAG TPA: phosphatidylserine decarboxylase [Candidatus Paceibacterota bacterium]|nr:phosphatidylserine decarboxylase [Verrucomicrobiota bacterium]HRZ44267.1 phosphatidylserine decarboxylase [Candidatus Paceibacterota bacterium]HRZ94719.1 phosphatidylserine decarboxylase [Candidatus Paceibacterota bacterium]
MRHKGKAGQAAGRIILWTLVGMLVLLGAGVTAVVIGSAITLAASVMFALWIVLAGFTLFFFRDPDPAVPGAPGAILSPAHGRVDVVDEIDETEFLGGRCRRISMFMSPLDVHVQKAPLSARVVYVRHHPGVFLAATQLESAARNENVMIGLESVEHPGLRIGVRLVAGVLARRIVPWIQEGETVARGERISLIQFGSRCEVYLPLNLPLEVKLGDRVRGGESIVAHRI